MTPEEYRWKAHAMLIRDEGLRLRVYKCTAGFNTLGVGRNLDARGVKGCKLLYYKTVGISRETALKWLDEDIAIAEADCLAVIGPEYLAWSPYRRLGWMNMAFNLGRDGFAKFWRTIGFAKKGQWDIVKRRLMGVPWYRQVKSRGPRVVALICDERWTYG